MSGYRRLVLGRRASLDSSDLGGTTKEFRKQARSTEPGRSRSRQEPGARWAGSGEAGSTAVGQESWAFHAPKAKLLIQNESDW